MWTGIPLLLALAPLPILTAAKASGRYSHTLFPIFILLFVRGLDALGGWLDLVIRRFVPSLPRGATLAPLAVAMSIVAWTSAERWLENKPPDWRDIGVYTLAEALKEHFPDPGGAACLIREANVMAGRSYCPMTSCPFGTDSSQFEACIDIMRAECAGTGAFPYVAATWLEHDDRPEKRRAMDAWALETFPTVATIRTFGLEATILAIPRSPSMPSRDQDTSPGNGSGNPEDGKE